MENSSKYTGMKFNEIKVKLDHVVDVAKKIAKRIPESIRGDNDPFLGLWDDEITSSSVMLILFYLKKYDCLSELSDLLESDAYARYYSVGYSTFHKEPLYILFDRKQKSKEVDITFWELVEEKFAATENAQNIIGFFDHFLQRFCRDYYNSFDHGVGWTGDLPENYDELIEQAEAAALREENEWHKSCFNGLLRQMIGFLNQISQEDYVQSYAQIVKRYVPHRYISDNYDLLFHEISIKSNDSVWLNMTVGENGVASRLKCKQIVFTTDVMRPGNLYVGGFYTSKKYQAWCSSIIQCIVSDAKISYGADMIIPVEPPVEKSFDPFKFYRPNDNDTESLVDKYIESHPTTVKPTSSNESKHFVEWLLHEANQKPTLLIDDIVFDEIWDDDYLVADKERYIDYILENAIDKGQGRCVIVDHSMTRKMLQSPNSSEKTAFLQKHIAKGIVEKMMFFQDCTIVFFNLAHKDNFVKLIKADHLCFDNSNAWNAEYNRTQKERLLEELLVADQGEDTPHVRILPVDFLSGKSLDSRRLFPATVDRVNTVLRRVFERELKNGVDFDEIYLTLLLCVSKALYIEINTDSKRSYDSLFVDGEEEVLFDNPAEYVAALFELRKETQRGGNSIVPDELVSLVREFCTGNKDSEIFLPYAGDGSFFAINTSSQYFWREENPLHKLYCELRSYDLKNTNLSDFYTNDGLKYGCWYNLVVRPRKKFQMIVSFPPLDEEKKLNGYCSRFYEETMRLLSDDGTCIAFVPTEFIVSAVYKSDRQKIVENKWLDKVVVLPGEIKLGKSLTMLVLNKSEKCQYAFWDASYDIKNVNSNVVLDVENVRHFLCDNSTLRVAYNEMDNDFAFCKLSTLLPMDPSLMPVGEVLIVVNGTRPSVASGPVVEDSYFDNDRFRDLSARNFKVKAVSSKMRKFDSSVMVVSTRTIAGIGRPLRCIYCRATSDEPVYIDTNEFIVCSVDENRIVPAYLDSKLKKQYVSEQISLLTGRRNRIHPSDFCKLLIGIPSVKEQIGASQFSPKQAREVIQQYCKMSDRYRNDGTESIGMELLAHLYKLQCGENADTSVLSALEIERYNDSILDNDEIEVLRNNLGIVAQYVREHLPSQLQRGFSSIPEQIGKLIQDELAQYIPSGSTIYYPFANDASFAKLAKEYLFEGEEDNELVRAFGIIDMLVSGCSSAIRLGLSTRNRHRYDFIFSFPPVGLQGEKSTENIVSNLYNRLNEGGCMTLLLTAISIKKGVLENCFENNHIVKIIDLPKHIFQWTSVQFSLVVIQKIRQNSIKMVDARHFVSDENNAAFGVRLFDYESYKTKCVETSGDVEYEAVGRSLKGDSHNLNASYYVFLSKYSGIECVSLGEIADVVQMENPTQGAVCKKFNHDKLSSGFPRVPLSISNMEDDEVQKGMRYLSLHKDDVIVDFEGSEVKLGYIGDEPSTPTFIDGMLTVLRPKTVNVNGLMSILLTPMVAEQIDICSLRHFPKYCHGIALVKILKSYLVPSELQKMIEADMASSMSEAERELKLAYDKYRKDIHMRKHAIGQYLFNLSSYWELLCTVKDTGAIDTSYVIGKKHPLSIDEIMSGISNSLSVIRQQVLNLTVDDDDYSKQVISLCDFMEKYKTSHPDLKCKLDIEDLKVQGEHCVEFNEEALTCIVDNLIDNARSHGFHNNESADVIRFTMKKEENQTIVYCANNGDMISEKLLPDRIFEYGETSKQGRDAHSGLGCYIIKELMKKFGGSVSAESVPCATDGFRTIFILTFKNTNYGGENND